MVYWPCTQPIYKAKDLLKSPVFRGTAMEVTKTQRGAPMLLYQGYSYTVSRKCSSSLYWVCRDRKLCKAKLTTDESISVVMAKSGSHTHAGDPTEANLLKTRQGMKRKAGKMFYCFLFG